MTRGQLVSEISLIQSGWSFKRISGIAEEWVREKEHLYWSRKTATVIEVFTDNERYATH